MMPKKQKMPSTPGGAGPGADKNSSQTGQYSQGAAKTSDPFNNARNTFLDRIYEDEPLKTTTRFIALLLAECFNRDLFKQTGKLVAYPSHKLLAQRARISERQVQTHTAELVSRSIYEVKKGGAGWANEYTAACTDRKPTSGLNVGDDGSDQKPASGLNGAEEFPDRKPGAVRPELQRRQTGSPLPPTSETSDGAGGPSARPADTSVPESVVVNGAPDSGARSSAPDSALDAPAGAASESFPSDLEGLLARCLREIEQHLRGGGYSTSDEWWKHVLAKADEFERTWPGNQHKIDRWVDQAEAIGVFHDFPLDQQEDDDNDNIR